ncbi:unnamed protein product [Didymodactylos carnosus]|uniref:F-box domain-containing protein n=1 Tax=Didymodactylos carnosus TaxID=1234261 RepID=A0A815H387_9BILA|nr:unnamed protein product [Didymodactylos carnosus]CAF1346635.1 unnamed protein product [Didymodactylos carnosus]CAF3675176.1 unnamed protein product [Didymodactylos carnosus]CAF4212888.1 unnamed protein product [Didymodactylos carnosus]
MYERFPNEILIEIFQYLSTIDLFRSLVNINSRIESLIKHSTPFKIDLSCITTKSEYDYICKTILLSSSSPLHYLKLSNLIVQCEIQLFINMFDIMCLFSNLKSLSLLEVRLSELSIIIPKLKNVSYLSIISEQIDVSKDRKCLYSLIFCSDSSLSLSLNTLIIKLYNNHLQRVISYTLDGLEETIINKFKNLKYLDVDSCYLNDLKKLFSYIPNIKHLNVNLFPSDDQIVHQYYSIPCLICLTLNIYSDRVSKEKKAKCGARERERPMSLNK